MPKRLDRVLDLLERLVIAQERIAADDARSEPAKYVSRGPVLDPAKRAAARQKAKESAERQARREAKKRRAG